MVIKAKEVADKHGYFWINQFENEANAWIQEQTTGPEIVISFEGKRLEHFNMAYGTGGTFLGTYRYLRKHLPDIKSSAQTDDCQPSWRQMIIFQVYIQQLRYATQLAGGARTILGIG